MAIQIHILLRFLALCLCFEHLDDDLLLLNQESTLDPENKSNRTVNLELSHDPVTAFIKANASISHFVEKQSVIKGNSSHLSRTHLAHMEPP